MMTEKKWHNHNQQTQQHKYRGAARITLAVAVAFAMAFTVLPSAVVCADDSNTEPTLPASDMVRYNDDQIAGDTDSDGNLNGNGDLDNNTDTSSSLEDRDVTTGSDENSTDETGTDATENTETTAETTAAPETTTKITTTVNTSGKKWKTPKGNKVLSLTLCRNSDGTEFDLTAQAGQRLYEYDTIQGATAGKGYGYFSLYNRKNNHAKIVKVRLSTMEVVKVSAALDIRHANELAYNGKKNIIVVANAEPKPKRISIIDANTLKVKYHKTIKMPRKIKGMSKKQCKKFKGIGAIAYNEKHNCYVCRIRKTNDLLLLNASFKPYKRIKQKAKISGMLYQGLDSYKDCIMVCQSFKGKKKYNVITVYNMKGKKLARFTMGIGKPALELETIFHNGNQFYVGCYCCYGVKTDSETIQIRRDNIIFRINNL